MTMISMLTFSIIYFFYALAVFFICMILLDKSDCEQSMLIVFSLKQLFVIPSISSIQSYPGDKIKEQKIWGFIGWWKTVNFSDFFENEIANIDFQNVLLIYMHKKHCKHSTKILNKLDNLAL